MLWLHCDVTGMMGNPLSFPGRPESSDVTCSVDLLSPFMVHADSLYGLEFGAIPLHGFNFVLMIRILQCNVIMFHMWWLYIYKWLLMCADISSDILCSRQKNTFRPLHISSICAHRSSDGAGCGGSLKEIATQHCRVCWQWKILVICLGGNWWKLLVTQCTCEDFGGIFGQFVWWFGYLWHHLQWSKVGMVPGYLWIFREATRAWGCDQPLHWTTWGISSSSSPGFFPELANGSKIDRTPEHLMAKAMVSCTLW